MLRIDSSRRHELFEATLEMLDRNPAYVDEFFDMTRQHHATLERFTVDETRALKDPKLARLNAMYLRDQPEALQEVMAQIPRTRRTDRALRRRSPTQ